MFKSVFTKYLTVFLVITIIGFSFLAAILNAAIRIDHTEDLERRVQNAANYTQDRLQRELSLNFGRHESDFSCLNQSIDALRDIIAVVSHYKDLRIFIVDSTGVPLVVGNDHTDFIVQGGEIPHQIMLSILDDQSFGTRGTLDGFFVAEHVIYTSTLVCETGESIAAVIAASDLNAMSAMVDSMMRTTITACVFVMMTGLVACLLISEKLSVPLKDMRRASKDFATGKFDTRIKVSGKDEIAELGAAFNNMAQSLSELEDMRRSFIANVSHDLRTPMTSIAGFVDGILNGAIPPEKQAHYLNLVTLEIKRLSRLVTSLMDISRLESGDRKFNMKPHDICAVASRVLLSFEEKIESKELDVSFETSVGRIFIVADSDAIHQVLQNLVENAVKFSRKGGELRIKVIRHDNEAVVSIFNHGVGIATDDLPRVFDRFYKADKSRGLNKDGTGLGLFIAKTIVEAHGGTLTARSTEGEWCEFIMRLPIKNG